MISISESDPVDDSDALLSRTPSVFSGNRFNTSFGIPPPPDVEPTRSSLSLCLLLLLLLTDPPVFPAGDDWWPSGDEEAHLSPPERFFVRALRRCGVLLCSAGVLFASFDFPGPFPVFGHTSSSSGRIRLQ